MRDMKNVDLAIIKTIVAVRRDHHACTARAVANQLRMSPDVVRYRCDNLKRQGLVTWTPMAGSLRVLTPEPAVSEEAPEQPAPEPAADEPAVTAHVAAPTTYECTVCDRTFKGPAMLKGHLGSKAHRAKAADLVSTHQ